MGGHGGRTDTQLAGNRAIGKAHRQKISDLAFPLAQPALAHGIARLRSDAENAQHARRLFTAQVRRVAIFLRQAVPPGPRRADIHDDVQQMGDAARAAEWINLPIPAAAGIAFAWSTQLTELIALEVFRLAGG